MQKRFLFLFSFLFSFLLLIFVDLFQVSFLLSQNLTSYSQVISSSEWIIDWTCSFNCPGSLLSFSFFLSSSLYLSLSSLPLFSSPLLSFWFFYFYNILNENRFWMENLMKSYWLSIYIIGNVTVKVFFSKSHFCENLCFSCLIFFFFLSSFSLLSFFFFSLFLPFSPFFFLSFLSLFLSLLSLHSWKQNRSGICKHSIPTFK